MRLDVLEIAKKLARGADLEMIAADFIPIIFCPIDELEITLQSSTGESFFSAIRAGASDEYQGWHLSNLHRHIFPNLQVSKDLPFKDKLSEVLPWWARVETQLGIER